MSLNLNYYRGNESEQFSFYRIPKLLLTDKRYQSISMEAKMLYGLMLDRMTLSQRNNWLDQAGRVYIFFTLEDAISTTGFGKNKAVRLFKELDDIGLIERKKQGQGRPAIIYVKNFVLPAAPEETEETLSNTPNPPASEVKEPSSSQLGTTPEFLTSQNQTSKAGSPDMQSSESGDVCSEIQIPDETLVSTVEIDGSGAQIFTEDEVSNAQYSSTASPEKKKPAASKIQTSLFGKSALPEKGSADSLKPNPNNTEKKETEMSETDLSIPSPLPTDAGGRDRIDSMDECRAIVMKNIEYEALLEENPEDRELLAGYLELIVETVGSKCKTIRIGGSQKPVEDVRDRLLMLTKEHILYVLECMKANTTSIKNIRAYMLTALFNAPVTIRQYQASQRQKGQKSISYGVVPETPNEEMLRYIQEFQDSLARDAEQ